MLNFATRRFAVAWLLLIALIAMAPNGSSQSGNTQITGQITDSSGAVVPAATIVVLDLDRKVERRTQSNDAGAYRVPFLQPGRFDVTVQKQGFRPITRPGITLVLDQTALLDFVLEVGAVTEAVTVTGKAPMLDRESASVGQVVDQRRVAELPLLGRNILTLLNVTAGVQPLSGETAGFAESWNYLPSNVEVGGGRGSMNDIRLDGMDDTLPERHEAAVAPITDTVQEFKVTTSGASAEFGRSTGGVISIVTKSGTNQFHGTLYEYLQNNVLNARNTFSPEVPVERFNQFGGTLAGPVRRDKAFFVFGYEGSRYRMPVPEVLTVPTALQRDGDFSQTFKSNGTLIQIFNPASIRANPSGAGLVSDPFPGNIIPDSSQDRISKDLLAELPKPNQPPSDPLTNVENYYAAPSQSQPNDQWTGRFDYNLTNNHRLMFRTNYNRALWAISPVVAGQDFLNGDNREVDVSVRQVAASWTHTLSPRAVGQFTAGFSWQVESTPSVDAVTYLNKFRFPSIIPRSNLFGFVGLSVQDMNYDLGSGQAYDNGRATINASEVYTLSLGRHTLKFGGIADAIRLNRFQYSNLAGTFQFRRSLTQNPQHPANTGWGVATFLTGAVSGGSLQVGTKDYQRAKYIAGFIQDDWRLGSRDSLNIGLRYDLETNPVNRYNQRSNFNLTRVNSITGVPGVLEYAGVEYGGSPVPLDTNNFGPRFGFAHTIGGNATTVIRGSYGIFYQPNFEMFEGNLGWSISTPFSSPSVVGPMFYLSQGPTAILQPPGNSLGPRGFLGQGVRTRFPSDRVGYSQQWNLSLQRSISATWTLEAAYVGNKGTKLGIGGDALNVNQIEPQYLSLGLALQDQVPNPFYAVGAFGPTVSRQQSLLPYPAYQSVTVSAPHWGSSIYHSAQFTATRRFERGYSLFVTYTVQKLIDNMPLTSTNWCAGVTGVCFDLPSLAQNYYNRRAERSVNPSDVSQRLTVSSVVEFPFGRGRRWFREGPGAWALGGWELSGSLTAQTGMPLMIRGADNNAADRPNSTGRSAKLPSGQRSRDRWFDTNAFEAPPLYTYGNVGRTLPDVRGPGLLSLDLGLHKEFLIKERFRVQLRGEAFNFPNRTNLGLPDMDFLDDSFGMIASTNTPARIIQVAAKVLF